MSTATWQIGDVKVTRIIEIRNLRTPDFVFRDLSREDVIGQSWLQPHFATDDGRLMSFTQAFVLECGSRRIIVDTCIGNDKQRRNEAWHDLHGPFLSDLAEAGYPPESIDTVLCTHMHVDHVGWNTRLDNGRWVPTFPNAKYLFSRADWDYWRHQSEENALPRTGDYFQDSVLPVFESGQAQLVDGEHAIEDGVWLEPTPGHSPGHVSVRLRSGGKDAVMSGDLLHHPLQCLHPAWSTNFCWDHERSRATRLSFLESVADTETLVIPAHFPAPTAGYVESHASAFRFRFDGE